MIELKAAVVSAKIFALDILGTPNPLVEEVERETYDGREVWRITVSVREQAPGPFEAVPAKEYKSIFVDAETGEVLAMKIRELTA